MSECYVPDQDSARVCRLRPHLPGERRCGQRLYEWFCILRCIFFLLRPVGGVVPDVFADGAYHSISAKEVVVEAGLPDACPQTECSAIPGNSRFVGANDGG